MAGPEMIKPSDSELTTSLSGSVRLRVPESGKAIETLQPISVPGYVKRAAETFPDTIAISWKEGNTWKSFTYSQYLTEIRTIAKAFIQLGLEERHSVCILGFNSKEWFLSDLGAIFAGGIAVGIYTTNSPEACQYSAEISRANIIVVEDEQQLEKIQQIRANLPLLKAVVQYSGELKQNDVISWKQLVEIGMSAPDALVDERLRNIAINECCTLVFTSGTIGNPKAVMLSHDNLTFDATAIMERLRLARGCEKLISYLPLSHVAAQVVDIYLSMSAGASVYFADKNALKGSLVDTLQEVKPTKFLGVPRVYEKIYERMQQIAAQNGFIKKAIASWAKEYTLQHHLNIINGIHSKSWAYTLAKNIIFSKIKAALGFQECTFFCSAAAPLATDIKKYFMSIDIPVMECFGMSEASGGHTLAVESANNLSSIGMTIPGLKTKIHNPEPDGQGELCMYGRHVFMGYVDELEKTKEAVDDDGWLHTGDLGRVDEKGFVYITGRLKELLITAGGENVPPVPIEQNILVELPHISNAFLVGDKRKFLSLLVTLKSEVDPKDGTPLDTLLSATQQWLKSLGCPATTVSEVLKAGPDPKLMAAIQEGISRANQKATSRAQRVQKVSILPMDFSVPTGELGPTMKVKRRIVEQKYADIIEKMYN
ncbi:very long-chain-fatty-acid--CoA ligase bubblegum isoform X2 [Anthonomus grandis grandis]|uniref:very long-chain-fatty-acid--CoA ligase bubblegum isoform X2 n=1 Tax=Anthonomus grandis grandis TaxID=2921223 RepID=UPI002166343E|nr:very long-chain-fatty-acid--CoA ligase bubblegum isoform X2 [Anthonomus grandis grandis]